MLNLFKVSQFVDQITVETLGSTSCHMFYHHPSCMTMIHSYSYVITSVNVDIFVCKIHFQELENNIFQIYIPSKMYIILF